MKILLVVGARPNFIKVAALYKAFSNNSKFKLFLLHTGQHYDSNMSQVFFDELGLPVPDINLEVSGGSHTFQTANIMLKAEKVIEQFGPQLIMVVGDVNSTLAIALIAAKNRVPIAHVEAGLRSFDRNMPEEINRIVVDHLSDFLFITEESAQKNLLAEGISKEKIWFVGNVMVDTLFSELSKTNDSIIIDSLDLQKQEYIVVTLHRPSNSDNLNKLRSIFEALLIISKEKKIVFPIHPRTIQKLKEYDLYNIIKQDENFMCIDPLGYIDFISLVRSSFAVLTDSGGIQEEASILEVPCLTIRENTERPVTITHGTNILVGCVKNDIVKEFQDIFINNKIKKTIPLWDGKAASRIKDIILDNF